MDLANYYKTMWEMHKKHGVSITEFYNMIPFEREIYLDLTLEYLEKLAQNQE
jgi:hypothetical protein